VTDNDKRLIEDYLPIQAIGTEAARRPRFVRDISSLHLWWARRPLVACRAAIYGALVPASRFIPEVNLKYPPRDADTAARRREGTARGLGRGSAAQFVERLCKNSGASAAIAEAARHLIEAHAERLAAETASRVPVEGLRESPAHRPMVLDMFAGGGAIPLEALRLGCDAHALDLNPVAYIIELCALVYPQKYGQVDRNQKGCAKDGAWAGLAEEVRHWSDWVLQRVKEAIGDLYPVVPDPTFTGKHAHAPQELWHELSRGVPEGYLVPVAYLWTRTVVCKNPSCRAAVPLVRQTWLCKKKGRYAALRMVPAKAEQRARFEVVRGRNTQELGFDPESGSKGGSATCPFCGTTADDSYVREQGVRRETGTQLMAIVCSKPGERGKVYLSGDAIESFLPDDSSIRKRIEELCLRSGLTVPAEPINSLRPSPWTRGASGVTRHGMTTWGDLFTARQLICLLTYASVLRKAESKIRELGYGGEHCSALLTHLALILSSSANFLSTICRWQNNWEVVTATYSRQALPMVWDFAEMNGVTANQGWPKISEWACEIIAELKGHPAEVLRGSATALPWGDSTMDAVITDPPYYDNVPYADISDFFYVWLRRAIGHLYPEHFASELTPKKTEITALSSRHGGDMEKARREYESMMGQAFREAHRVLKPGGPLVVVYAHKTTLGWSTLVEALRTAGFEVTEAWPLDTEMKSRLLAMETSALASSIFIIARKRAQAGHGRYEEDVRAELEAIVRERVGTLWDLGISGADLVIACVGAGLRAFTRYGKVEFANGEEVPAERFLTEVETAVLESILARLSKEVGGNGGKHSLAGVDSPTRFYTLWRYTYKAADLDAGEAIIFANGTHVELDGAGGLSAGPRSLVEKKKGKYRLRDYTERGEDDNLGLPQESGEPAPLVDILHRTLWLMERRPGKLAEFLREAQMNREQMRLVAQALAGPALKGSELSEVSSNAELSALAKLTANWRSLVEEAAMTPAERDARTSGQKHLDFGKEGRK